MNVISMCIADLEAEIYSKDRQYILMTPTSLFDSTELSMDVLFLQGQKMTREPIIILYDQLFFFFFLNSSLVPHLNEKRCLMRL